MLRFLAAEKACSRVFLRKGLRAEWDAELGSGRTPEDMQMVHDTNLT